MGLAEPTRVECCPSKEGNRAGTESWIPECWSEMQIRWDPWGAFPAAHGRSCHGCYWKWQWSSVKASRFCFKRTQKSFWQGERGGNEKKRRRRKRRRRRERERERRRREGEGKEGERGTLPPLSLHFFSTSSFEVRITATRGQHEVKKQLRFLKTTKGNYSEKAIKATLCLWSPITHSVMINMSCLSNLGWRLSGTEATKGPSF